MNDERHLALSAVILAPSEEWTPQTAVWLMTQVEEGEGYWIQPNAENRSLSPGDGLVIANKAKGAIRASQLGKLKLRYFTVLPEFLNGLLTVAEWHCFQTSPIRHAPHISFFAAADPSGKRFTQLNQQPQADSLEARCALAHLWFSTITNLLPEPALTNGNLGELQERFRSLVGRMTEAEFSKCSASDLARQLQCSERHLTRLFRSEFRTSLHALQIEFRLRRAQQLLRDSKVKIIDVAYESGHNNLSLFNVFFKRRFGLTPSQWRRQNTLNKVVVKNRGPLQKTAARIAL